MFDRNGCRKYLNTKERQSYIQEIQNENDLGRKTFLLTLAFTGCRISEALNLTVGRIDVSQKIIVFETLKQRQKGVFRGIPTPDDLIKLLEQATKGAGLQNRVWQFSRSTGYRIVKEYMRRVGIVGIMSCPKGLRHTFGVRCTAKSVPLPTIQKWMGHARMETTAIYLNVCGEEERCLAEKLWLRD